MASFSDKVICYYPLGSSSTMQVCEELYSTDFLHQEYVRTAHIIDVINGLKNPRKYGYSFDYTKAHDDFANELKKRLALDVQKTPDLRDKEVCVSDVNDKMKESE